MPRRPLLLSFFGPSYSGKSLGRFFAAEYLKALGYKPIILDVALPLREIQRFAMKTLELEDPGDPTSLGFNQDGKLLGSLAARFSDQLGPLFEKKFNDLELHRETGDVAVLNADCRSNAYPYLKKLGFQFCFIQTCEAIRWSRKRKRGDITDLDNLSPIDATTGIPSDLILSNDTSDPEFYRKSVRALIAEVTTKWELKNPFLSDG